MSQPPPTVPRGPQAAAADAQWALAAGVASVMLGILSLLLIGAYSVGIVRRLPYAASFACGIVGAVLGHVARAQARHAAADSSTAPLALVGLVLSYVGVFLSVAIFALVTPVTRTVSY